MKEGGRKSEGLMENKSDDLYYYVHHTSRRMHGIFGERERAHNDCICTSHPAPSVVLCVLLCCTVSKSESDQILLG